MDQWKAELERRRTLDLRTAIRASANLGGRLGQVDYHGTITDLMRDLADPDHNQWTLDKYTDELMRVWWRVCDLDHHWRIDVNVKGGAQ